MKETANSESEEITHYVGIGASAGGLEAIENFFRNMPDDSDLAFIVIQHLSPDYKSLMVELLSKKTAMKVLRAEEGMKILPNHVYLIPPKKNLTIFHGYLVLKDPDYTQGINLPIDIFFRSLAQDQGDRSIGIILSGTGSDGTRGIRAIKEFNGMAMVQDEKSAKFDGMPRAAISTGLIDFILPPEKMPQQLMAYVKHPYESRNKKTEEISNDEDSLTRIFSELRERTHVDFTFYKPNTIIRRIERRMTVCQTKNLEEYVRYLYHFSPEIMSLYKELLIGVTNFFRDPEAFSCLATEFLPKILAHAGNRELRLWCAGCSTGEEAYTLAILVKETMELLGISKDVKIFATDIDKDAVMKASTGIYPESIAADLSPRLLSKYFYANGDHYQITRNIRQMVVFARHNLVMDPPFTNIDLISCRNLLIYLQPILQQKAMRMFNFSLNPGGILFLGSSETVGEMAESFLTLSQRFKIYETRGKLSIEPEGLTPISQSEKKRMLFRDLPIQSPMFRYGKRDESQILNRFIAILPNYFSAAVILVNEGLEILYTLGNTEGFFRIPEGRVAYDISKMAIPDLSVPLTTAIQKVFRHQEPLTYTNVRVQIQKEIKIIEMKVIPVPDKKGMEPLVAVFLEIEKDSPTSLLHFEGTTYDIDEDAKQRIQDLDQELQFTRENLQATIEELETANEELQATNEELLASNEELQSTNEELQSTNEELYTVNAEFQNKINELTELNNDVDNLLTSSKIGKLLLDEDFQIRRFSPEVANIFLMMPKDIGRPLHHLAHRLLDCDPIEEIRRVLQTNQEHEQTVTTLDQQIYLMRVLPYQIGPGQFSGVVVTFVDITEIKKTKAHLLEVETELRRNKLISQNLFTTMSQGVVYQGLDGKILSVNPSAQRILGRDFSEILAKTSEDDDWQAVDENSKPLKGEDHPSMVALHTAKPVYNFTMGIFNPKLQERRWLLVNAIPELDLKTKKPFQVYTTFEDITFHIQAKTQLKLADTRMEIFCRFGDSVLWEYDLVTKKLQFSENLFKVMGIHKDEIKNLDQWLELIHREDYDIFTKSLKSHFDGTCAHYSCSYRIQSNGKWFRIFDQGEITLRDQNHHPLVLTGVFKREQNE